MVTLLFLIGLFLIGPFLIGRCPLASLMPKNGGKV